MFTKKFWLDTLERVLRSAPQGYFAAWTAKGLSYGALFTTDNLKGAAVASALALFMAFGLKPVQHDSETSSVIPDKP